MENILKLRNPVMINGKSVSEMSYDSNEITGEHYVTAEAKRKTAAGIKNVSVVLSAELDTGLHLYLGFAAIIAVNPEYDWSDMERIKGADVIDILKIGRAFMLKLEDTSAESNSDENSETTPESTTPESENSNESDSQNLS